VFEAGEGRRQSGQEDVHGGADHRQASRGGGCHWEGSDRAGGGSQSGVTEQTFYRWRKEYGGLRLDQAARLKMLGKENQRLKKIVADQAVDIAILKEAAEGNF